MVSRNIIRTLTVVIIVFILLCMAAVGFYFGLTYVLSQNARFARLDDQFSGTETGAATGGQAASSVELVVPRAADTHQIAELLEKKGIIKNPFMFTLLSKFNGFDGSYMAGTHYLNKDMSYDEIMYILSLKPHAVRVTFPEGLTYREIKAKLKAAGVNFDEKTLDSMVRNPQLFLDYDFVTQIAKQEKRDWLLQGYLFPDTYEFDINTDEETIIRTFLNNTEKKFITEYTDRAEKIGKTMDEIITLASIIENECSRTDEMRRVSGVFYNRLNSDDTSFLKLQSCATVNYLFKENGIEIKLWLSNEDINLFDNPYNTYLYEGLPPGPICSPGEDSIRAALWPESHGYYYFCAKGDGSNAFAETLAKQEANIEYYQNLAESGQTEATTEETGDE